MKSTKQEGHLHLAAAIAEALVAGRDRGVKSLKRTKSNKSYTQMSVMCRGKKYKVTVRLDA